MKLSRPKFGFLWVVVAALCWSADAAAQVELTSIPEPVNGVVEVCAGSTVLFLNETDASDLDGQTTYDWNVPGITVDELVAGPVFAQFDTPGTYTVSLGIVTLDGDEDLGEATLTVVVSTDPPLIPELTSGNSCTIPDTLQLFTEVVVFQTQSGTSSCTCNPSSWGPLVTLAGTDQYPAGTTSHIYWGGPGNAANGGTAAFTTQTGFPTATEDLAFYPGQTSPAGHYSNQGSYNLVHVVEFPGGCTYSDYYVVSWGAALIDQCANAAQSVCFPLDYPLCFDTQAPGTTYNIDWGDGSPIEQYVYPNLPTIPNQLGHAYDESCDEEDSEATQYTIIIEAENSCTNLTTVNSQGPFYVSTTPLPGFTMDPIPPICQLESITFTDTSFTGFEAGGAGCFNEYFRAWTINGSSNPNGFGYTVQGGDLGDAFWFVPGTEVIDVQFTQPGSYDVTLTVSNTFCDPLSVTHTVVISPIPFVNDQEVTLCTEDSLDFIPDAPPAILPPGTYFEWTVTDNPNVIGDVSGSGTSIQADLFNQTNVLQTVVYTVTPIAPGPCPGDPFMLTVDIIPTILVPNANLTLCNGQTAFIAPSNNDPNTILPENTLFSWTYTDNPNVTGESNGTNLSQFIQTLTSSVIFPPQSVEYEVIAQVEAGSCEPDTFLIEVTLNDVDAGVIAEDQVICPGGDPLPFTFSSPAVGSGTLSYQWQSLTPPSTDWVNIPGATAASYDPPSGLLDETAFRVVVTSTLNGVACSDVSNEVLVEINAIEIPEIAPDQIICAGDDPTPISIISGGESFGSPSYQWQQLTSLTGLWTDIPGATDAEYDPPAGASADLWYRLVLTSTAEGVECAVVSDTVLVDVNTVDPGIVLEPQVICLGDTPEELFVVGASGDGALTYEWFSSFSATGPFVTLVGDGPTYQPPGPWNADTWYLVEVTSTYGGVACSSSTLPVGIELNGVGAGGGAPDQTICSGGDPVALVPAELPTGEGTLFYQWQQSTGGAWTDIPGATSVTYDPPGGLILTTQYRMVVSSSLGGADCPVIGPVATVFVNDVDAGTITGPAEVCEGGDPPAMGPQAIAMGSGTLTFQWQSASALAGPWQDIAGATGLSYNPPAGITETTFFRLVVTSTLNGVACTDVSNPLEVTVIPDPTVTLDPVAATSLCLGGSLAAPFEVAGMEGLGDLTFQWYDEAGLIAGATLPTFDPSPFDQVGSFSYYAVLSWSGDGCDAATTATAEVTVLPDPVVTVEPEPGVWCLNAPAAPLTVEATGGVGALAYQWFVASNAGLTDGTAISGATSAQYTPPTNALGTLYYYCVITTDASGCEVTSGAVPVEVTPAPVITSVLDDVIGCVGAAFPAWTIEYEEGTGTPTYQWYMNTVPSVTGATLIPAATQPTFTPPSNAAGVMHYFCVVTFPSGGCGEVTSPVVTAEVVGDPIWQVEPLPAQTLCPGGTLFAPFTASYTLGTGTPTWQWFLDGAPIPGANGSSYLPGDFNAVGTFAYTVIVSVDGNGCDAITSADAVVNVIPDPVVSAPVSADWCQGAVADALEVSATGGTGGYTYQWVSGPDPSSMTPILGATGASYVPPTDAVGAIWYACIVTGQGANCETESAPALITVTEAPQFTVQPAPDSVCIGGPEPLLEVAFTNGTGTPTYQWYSAPTNNIAAGTPISGAIDPSYAAATGTVGTTWYYCVISLEGGGCDEITSDLAPIVITPLPTLDGGLLGADSLCVGGTLAVPLEVSYSSGSGTATYQWFYASGQIPGATASTYLPPAYTTPGTFEYSVVVTLSGAGCGSLTSSDAVVVVVDDPIVDVQPLDASYCQNGAGVADLFIEVSGGTGTFSFQWQSSPDAPGDWSDIPGATSISYLPPVDQVGTMYYQCVVTQSGANCSVISDPAEIITTEAPEFTTEPFDQEVCLDGTLLPFEVTYTNGTGTPQYQWYESTTDDITAGTPVAGATNASYTPPSDAVGTVYYYCIITLDGGGCDEIVSQTGAVNVVPDPIITLQPLATDTVCVGGALFLDLEIAYGEGTGDVTYQWFVDGSPIANSDSPTYLPPGFTTPGTFHYHAEVTLSGSGCDAVASDSAEVVVVDDPVVDVQPIDASYCQDGAGVAELFIEVSGGTGTFSFQWQSSSSASGTWSDIPGATSISYLPPVDQVGTMYYQCVVTQSGANCSVISDPAEIITTEAPEFTTEPFDQEVCLDGTLQPFEVTYTNGTGTPQYQWYASTTDENTAGTAISGATNASYTPPSDAVGTLYYYCIITLDGGGCDEIVSQAGAVNVVPDPIITLQPLATDTLCVGGTLYLDLEVASGEGTGDVTYQWFVDGSPIANSDSPTYLPPGFTTPGTFHYHAEVTLSGSGCDAVASDSAEVVVVDDPVVDVQPIDASYCQNGAGVADLFIEVSGGTGTFSFQWQSSPDAPGDWSNIPGATSISYLPPVDQVGTMYYQCVVTQSSANCSVISDPAEIITTEAPEFTTEPFDQEVCLDGTLQPFEVTYTNGTGTPQYQWYESTTDDNTAGTPIAGATNASYTPPSDAVGTVYYYCIITLDGGGCDEIVSQTGAVNVVPDPIITLQPLATDTLCVGGTLFLDLEIAYGEGTGDVTYQWFVDGSPIANSDSPTYMPPGFTTPGTFYYHAEVTLSGSGCDAVASDSAEVVVVDDPVVDVQPIDASYCQNGAGVAELFIEVSGGTGTFSYQWQSSPDTPGDWSDIPGATSISYMPPVDQVGTMYYQCVVTQSGANCEVISDPAEIITTEAPEFTTEPFDQEVCLDGTLQPFEVTYTNGTGTPQYQWYASTTDDNTAGTPIEGATSANFTPPSDAVGTLYYYCIITLDGGGCDEIVSLTGAVNVVPDPIITLQPLATDTLCVGGTLFLDLEIAYGEGTGDVTYQWFVDGSPIANSDSPTYLPPGFTTPGTFYYHAEVTLSGSGCDAVASDSAEVVVLDDPIVDVQPIDASYCQNGAGVAELFIEVSGGTGTFSFQWQSSPDAPGDWSDIPGATSISYLPPFDQVGTIYYRCVVTQSGANCEVVCDPAEIITTEAPEFTTEPFDQEVCLDGTLLPFEVMYINGTGTPQYQWYESATFDNTAGTPIAGATNANYTPPSDAVGTLFYYCIITLEGGGCDEIVSQTGAVNVVPDPIITLQPLATDTLCVGGTLFLNLEIAYGEGTGDVTYQWFVDGSPIANSDSPTYLPPGFATPGTFYYHAEVTLSGSGCDAVASDSAEVVVVDDPVVDVQPVDASYCQNGAGVAELFIEVSGGTGTFSFQWQSSPNALDPWTDIPGATSISYLPPVDQVGTMHYRCVVTQSGANCEVVCDPAEIITTEAPEFTTEPFDQEVCLDGTLLPLEVEYENGTGTPQYQWYASTTDDNTVGTPIDGATGPSYTPPTDAVGTLYYYCIISLEGGGCDEIVSQTGTVNVVPDPVISLQPLATDTLCVGGTLYLELEIAYEEGTGSPTYEWFVDGSPILNSDAPTYLPPAFTNPGTFQYHAEVTLSGSGCDPVASDSAEVVVVADPVVDVQPVDAAYCQNGAGVAELFIEVSGGTGTYSFQWQSSPNALDPWTDIPGATSISYLPPVDQVGTMYYRCVVTQSGANCEVVSDPAEIITTQAPEFTTEPFDQEVCLDGTLLSLEVDYENGTGTPQYQWYVTTTDDTDVGTPIAGATAPSYTPPTDAVGTLYYYCIIALEGGGCDEIVSVTGEVNVVPDPVITLQPLATDTLCVGGTLHLELEIAYGEGTGTPTYEWFVDGTPIPNSNNPTYLPPTFDNPGTFEYYAEVTLSGSGCDVAATELAEVIVVDDPVVDVQPVDASYCQFASPVTALFVEVSGGTGAFSFQWQSAPSAAGPWQSIAGANDIEYVPSVDVVGTLHYRLVVTQTGANCLVISDPAAIETTEAPTFTEQPLTQTLCVGEEPLDLAVAYQDGTGTPSYQWFSSATGSTADGQLIPGETSSAYTPPTDAAGLIWYYCVISFDIGGCSDIVSDLAGIYVNGVNAGTVLEDQGICSGQQPEPLEPDVQATGNGDLTYQWLSQPDAGGPLSPVAGALTATWQPPVLFDTIQYALQVTSTWNGVGCADTTNVLEILVYPLPQVDPFPSLTICNDESVELSIGSDLASTYEWVAISNNSVEDEELTVQGTNQITDSLHNPTTQPQYVTYEVTATSVPYGCEGPTVEAVVEVMPDVVLNSLTAMEMCSDAPVNALLTTNVPSTFEWFVTVDNPNVTGESLFGGSGSLISDVLVNTSQVDQMVIYSITPTSINGDCEGAAQTLAVLVKPPLAVTSPNEVTLCSGDAVDVQLVANTDVLFNWYAVGNPAVAGESTGITNSDFIGDVLTALQPDVQQVQYQIIATSVNNGCSSPLTPLTVQVNPEPNMVHVPAFSVCHEEPVDAIDFEADVVGTTYVWASSTPDAVGQEVASGAGSMPGWIAQNLTDEPQQTTVTVSPTFTADGVGCPGEPMAFGVTVQPVPQVNPLADLVACEDEAVPGIAWTTEVAGTVFEWEVDALNVGLAASGSGSLPAFVAANDGLNSLEAVVTVTPVYPNAPNNCLGSPESFELTVHPAPDVVPVADAICSGGQINLPLEADLPSTFTWSAAPNPLVFGETAWPVQTSSLIADVLTQETDFPQTVTYTVSATSTANGCPGPAIELEAVVNPLPTVAFTTLNLALCDSVDVFFQNNSIGNLEYTWTFDPGEGTSVENPVVVFPDVGEYAVQLHALNPLTGCADSTSQTLTVYETPNSSFTWSDSTACGPEEVTFTAGTYDEDLMYMWLFGDGDFSTAVGATGNVYAPGDCYDVSLTLTSQEGCTSTTAYDELFCAYVQPSASFTATPMTTTILQPDIEFTNQSLYASSYAWDFGDGAASYEAHPMHSYSQPGTYQVTLYASNSEVCNDAVSLPIVVKPHLQVYVPNAYTADQDGLNDAWKPSINHPELLDAYRLHVFNRWGEEVFYTENPNEWWIGDFEGGEYYVQNEVYTWLILLDVQEGVAFDCPTAPSFRDSFRRESDCVMKGHVTIVR